MTPSNKAIGKMIFNVGDRVKYDYYGNGTGLSKHSGSLGIVVDLNEGPNDFVKVEWDRGSSWGRYRYQSVGHTTLVHSSSALVVVQSMLPYDPIQQGDREDDV